MILYEVTIEVQPLMVRILFNAPPTVQRLCEAVETVFAEHTNAKDGLLELILSVGDQEEWKAQVLNVGDVVNFSNDDGPIGQMDVQTRTLFDA